MEAQERKCGIPKFLEGVVRTRIALGKAQIRIDEKRRAGALRPQKARATGWIRQARNSGAGLTEEPLGVRGPSKQLRAETWRRVNRWADGAGRGLPQGGRRARQGRGAERAKGKRRTLAQGGPLSKAEAGRERNRWTGQDRTCCRAERQKEQRLGTRRAKG